MSDTLIPLDFTQQHVMVFGGTTGINLGIAQAFHARGASVSVASRSADNVRASIESMSSAPDRIRGSVADIRDEDAVSAALRSAVDAFGPIHVLIQGAAGNFLCAAKALSPNGFKVVVDIDLVGTFNVMRRAYEHLSKPGACVINITAPQSYIPMRYQIHVCAAKAGVDQLTRVLALEWGPEGVRVNSISPGPIAETEGVRRLMPLVAGESFANPAIPLGRMGQKRDIANLALFLASPYGAFISGAVIPCDGGGSMESVKTAVETAGAAVENSKAERPRSLEGENRE
jgi:NAD(P)-dependent dehydrogenase (short-subunit alcohol dehydrogenase family)